jgi:2',3'-cyclic-nucleotide 2'-phosphodiesterase (5'-nucleotidase family)
VTSLPPALPGTEARILATTDLGANAVPLPTSYGTSGTLAGIVELLDRERELQPTLWLDVGDLVVGNPSHPLLGERPWADVADLPIAAAAAGNHEFDDGVDALLEAARRLSFPLLCANVDVGLPPSTLLARPAASASSA